VKDEVKLDKYLDAIFRFTDMTQAKNRINISYRLWNVSSEAADEYNVLVMHKLEQRFNPGFSIPDELKKGNRIKLGDKVFFNIANVFQWPSMTAKEIGSNGFCLGLRDQVGILVDGTVVPCCLDGGGKINLGNIFKEDFSDILSGERAKLLYDGFSNRKATEELCKRCGYRTRFSKEFRK